VTKKEIKSGIGEQKGRRGEGEEEEGGGGEAGY